MHWLISVSIGGVKVGIIGYVIKDRSIYDEAMIKDIVFKDEIKYVQEEATRLKTLGVNIIIAAGHAGYDLDQKMAREIDELDLVVGGHSHTYLFTSKDGSNPPSIETPLGDYPTYVRQKSGKVVPVVQVFCYTKYLGHLELHFDADVSIIY